MQSKLLTIATTLFLAGILYACGGGGAGQESASQSSTSENTPEKTSDADPVASVGKKVYTQYCYSCHQAEGVGVQGLYPPINKGTEWVTGDKARLIGIILNGMQGEIEVHGETYNNAMPQHGYLSNEEVAGVLTYIRSNWGNNAGAVTAEEVEKVRAES